MGRVIGRGEIALEGLEALFDAGHELSALRAALVELLGPATRLVGSDRFKSRVRRLRVETAGSRRSVVVKQLGAVVAHRNRMVVERWLPAVGLEALGPGLLAWAADARSSWQIYQDWGDAGLDRDPNDRRRVRAAVRAIADLHLRFADHPLLGECRQKGGDLGRAFFGGNARDALRALEAMAPAGVELPGRVHAACDQLMAQLQGMLDEESDRARALEELGGPETLVHGDLWLTNVFVLPADDWVRVRLIDWDHAGVARFSYDLSTLLIRFPSSQRPDVLADYEEAVAARGWRLPDAHSLNGLFDTAERSRIASHVLWPALALLRGDAALRDWALEALPDVNGWFDQLGPVLPLEQSAVA
ncbi:MAG: phosphotransferase [Myxococcota bacterium]